VENEVNDTTSQDTTETAMVDFLKDHVAKVLTGESPTH
jgi:hypothetical protein